MRFGEIFKTSLFKFSNYPSLLLVGNFKTALYVLFLALIMLCGITAVSVPPIASNGGLSGLAEDNLPDFTIKDGKLSCKKINIDDKNTGMYILVDDTREGQIPLPDDYTQAVTISKTDLLIRNDYQVNSLKLSEFGDVSKTSFVEWLKKNSIFIYIFFALFMLFCFTVSLLVNMLILALLGKAVNALFIRASLRFGEIFKLTVFSMTFSVMLNMIFTACGLGAFSTIAPFITLFYLIKGMQYCRRGDGIVIEVLE